jgi:periplasmic divalent cation tolerance protein
MTHTEARIVFCTCPESAAPQLARAVVSEGLAACVNILPAVTSIYVWEGELEESAEAMLVIKTTADGYPELAARLQREHPYDVPEIIEIPILRGNPAYLSWLVQSVSAGASPPPRNRRLGDTV